MALKQKKMSAKLDKSTSIEHTEYISEISRFTFK